MPMVLQALLKERCTTFWHDFGTNAPKSGGFNCKDCSHVGFVEVILAWTLGTVRLGSSSNCN